MTSKFFAEDGEQSDHASNEEVSDVEEEKKQQTKKVTNYFSESSEEEEGRRVKTEKEKRYDAIKEVIEKIKEKIKIKDFGAILDGFDDLNKQVEKAKKIVEKEGVPIFYTRICWALENLVNSLSSEDKKALKPANARAFNSLKHNLKKNNKKYEAKIAEFAKNPVYSDKEEPEPAKKEKKTKTTQKETDDKPAKTGGKGADSDDSLSGKQSSSESDSDEEDESQYLQSDDPQVRRKYWLLKKRKKMKSMIQKISNKQKQTSKPKEE